MLGISPNIYWAVGWRFANGILNGAPSASTAADVHR